MRVCPFCRQQFPAGSNFCPFDGKALKDLEQNAATNDPFLGMVVDERYKIESRLGSGSMGNVYAARHVIIDKPVAIKILRQRYSNDPPQAERFIREARAASRIGHPNIIDITDFGKLKNGQIYFVMEYMLGVTLGKEIHKHGALPIHRSLDLTIQICHALEAAHAVGIIHRDLKPENIFVVNPVTSDNPHLTSGQKQDVIKVLDFGIAKMTWDDRGGRLTKAGSVFGTPEYMSPEQAAGQDTDHRSDIYALGIILYELLTGELPFIADTYMGTLTKQMFEKPVAPRELRPDLNFPMPLEQIVLKSMEKNPEHRFGSMKELAEALVHCASLLKTERHSPSMPADESTPKLINEIPRTWLAKMDGSTPVEEQLVPKNVPPDATPNTGERFSEFGQLKPFGRKPRALTAIVALSACVLIVILFLIQRTDWHEFQQKRAISPSRPSAIKTKPPPNGKRSQNQTTIKETAKGVDGALPLQLSHSRTHGPDKGKATIVPSPQRITFVTLVFKTIPKGCQIFEKNFSVGRTPLTLKVERGRPKKFVFRKAGYHEHSLAITPHKNKMFFYRLTPLSAAKKPKSSPSSGTNKEKIIKTPYGSSTDLRNPFKKSIKKGRGRKPGEL